jgi:CubicO group peptidase (beta-lactamase class C family)
VSKKHLTCALANTAIWLVASANAAIVEPDYGSPAPCNHTRTRAVGRLEEVVAAVQTGVGANVSAVLDRDWAPSAQDARAEAEPTLIRWTRGSQNLHLIEVCARNQSGASAYYQNGLTGLIDFIHLTVEEGGDGRITTVFSRAGFRTEPDPAYRRNDSARVAKLNAFVDVLSARGLFSGVVLIARDGVPIYTRANGTTGANNRPIKVGDLFEMASSTKMFTAVAIFQLIEHGQLSLNTTVAQAAPSVVPSELPAAYANHIQIRHLLSHTSGIRDGADVPVDAPGGSFAYANTNFYLLGKVIEAVSGMRYEDYLRMHILGPLGMANTSRFEMTRTSDALVTGYMSEVSAGRVRFVANPLLQTIQGGAQGGYYSTAGDMLRFATALRDGRLISRESLGAMRSVHPDLGATFYGFGMVRWRGRGIWGHAGDLPGADVDIEFYGDTPYTAIVLSNVDDGNYPLIAKIRALFYPAGGSGPPQRLIP